MTNKKCEKCGKKMDRRFLGKFICWKCAKNEKEKICSDTENIS